jgi:hypothetical protein
MDMFKSSAADGRSHKVGRHGDSRRLNENKLLSKNRFGNLGASGSKNCRLCKGMLHANQVRAGGASPDESQASLQWSRRQ